jgi:plasmid stabilization system protein ParE
VAYYFSPGAAERIEETYNYILEKFGIARAEKFRADLNQFCHALVDQPNFRPGRPRPEFGSGVRGAPFQKRLLIIYSVEPGGDVIIENVIGPGQHYDVLPLD